MASYIVVIVLVIIGLVQNYRENEKKKRKTGSAKPNQSVRINKPLTSKPPTLFVKKQISPAQQESDLLQETTTRTESIIDVPSLENNLSNQYNNVSTNTSKVELDSEESIAFDIEKNNTSGSSVKLDLETKEDLKKAFVYSLIFERKY